MIVIFYDKDFNALQNNASLNVGKYEIRKKAIDFDDFNCTSEAFVEDVNPCFVVLKTDVGRYKYGCFAGIPQINNDNQTSLQGSDLKTLLNNDVLIQFGTYQNLKEMMDYLFTTFNTQVIQNSYTVEFNTSDISNINLSILIPGTTLQVYNCWDFIVPYLKYYDCYMESIIDLSTKKIIFYIKKANKYVVPLKLWEHDIKNYGKWIASVNEAQAVVSLNGTLSYGTKYLLLSNNQITNVVNDRDIFPIKRKVFFKETTNNEEVQSLINEASIEALTTLVEARFNESITLPITGISRFENAGFDTSFAIYAKRGVLYKTLPIGTIYEDGTDKKELTIGYKPNSIVYYFK